MYHKKPKTSEVYLGNKESLLNFKVQLLLKLKLIRDIVKIYYLVIKIDIGH